MRSIKGFLESTTNIFKREPWWAEFWSAMTAISWAVLSYLNAADFNDWPSMRVFVEIGKDRDWYLLALSLGLFQLAFLLYDQRWLRWAAAIMLCWFWGVLTLGVWIALPLAPAAAVYAGWCGINIFSILRLLRPYDA